MTFEEMQKTIEQMLAVQRELQEGQFKLQERQLRFQENQLKIEENQARDRETIERMLSVQRDIQEQQLQMLDAVSRLIVVFDRHERRIEYGHLMVGDESPTRVLQLIGYSITGESDRLDLLQRLMNLEQRLKKLEDSQEN